MATRKNASATAKRTTNVASGAIAFPKRGGVEGAKELQTLLLARLKADQLQDLEIDCTQAEHLDAAILQVLFAGNAAWQARNQQVRLTGVRPNFQTQIVRTGADKQLAVWTSTET